MVNSVEVVELAWGCGTAVVMSRLYKVDDGVVWICLLTFISLVRG